MYALVYPVGVWVYGGIDTVRGSVAVCVCVWVAATQPRCGATGSARIWCHLDRVPKWVDLWILLKPGLYWWYTTCILVLSLHHMWW
jgi:hypothetical protein